MAFRLIAVRFGRGRSRILTAHSACYGRRCQGAVQHRKLLSRADETHTFRSIHIFDYLHMILDSTEKLDEMQPVFESAAELFGLLANPQRLRILRAICEGERSVSEIVALTQASQPNVSQNLALMYRHGVVARRRDGTQIYYSVKNELIVDLCRTVCTQIAMRQGEAVA